MERKRSKKDAYDNERGDIANEDLPTDVKFDRAQGNDEADMRDVARKAREKSK